MTELKEAIYQRGLAIADVARGVGINPTVLVSVSNRQRALPKRHRLAVAGLFGVQEETLFDEYGLARVATSRNA